MTVRQPHPLRKEYSKDIELFDLESRDILNAFMWSDIYIVHFPIL